MSTTLRDKLLLESLGRRILLLDGAMGTMIQRWTLGEADFRGTRFASHGRDLKGNNDWTRARTLQRPRPLHT
jgi:5-methyltetrahydrofolate--homocysteine methyltransferase